MDTLFFYFKSVGQEKLKPAGIGRASYYQINRFFRRDEIFWLDDSHPDIEEYRIWIEKLRLHLNRELYLGLFDFECHFAYYPTGAFYKKHLDAFKDQSSRRLSTVLYLNPQWNSCDGGQLLMYRPDCAEPFLEVLPLYGRMVIFLSEIFPHEVMRSNKGRYSLTGWYRINAGIGGVIDPPQ
ncbi:MAG: 2OG-Fe(II) oxygenase [Gammaproteobacteria bacterium]